MKRLFLVTLILILSIQFNTIAFAQIPSGDQLEKINEKVDELKDKVASKVAQLNLVEKRGIIGTVDKVTATQITLTDLKNNTRIIDLDELTKFSSEDNSSFDISDIKPGTQLSVLGLYNKDSERLLGRFINEISIPVFLTGVITDTNEDDFTITIVTVSGEKYLIDIERVTKSFSYADGDLETSGFSKINVGENVIVTGFKNTKEKNRITASRFIHLPGIPKDPNVKFEIQKQSPTITPTP